METLFTTLQNPKLTLGFVVMSKLHPKIREKSIITISNVKAYSFRALPKCPLRTPPHQTHKVGMQRSLKVVEEEKKRNL
jgi:hypothetical protein